MDVLQVICAHLTRPDINENDIIPFGMRAIINVRHSDGVSGPAYYRSNASSSRYVCFSSPCIFALPMA